MLKTKSFSYDFQNKTYVLLLLFTANAYWIGITDKAIEGLWRYYPSEEALTYEDWNPGEPNGHQAGNCAAIKESTSFRWFDDYCTSLYRAICEIP